MKDFWNNRSELAQDDLLRSVLDPSDIRGLKNAYIDLCFKYYLELFLNPAKQDRVLEIGCGYGRLTEYIAPYVSSIVGVDLAENFIKIAAARSQFENVQYYTAEQFSEIESEFDSAFMVGVAMFVENDKDLTDLLKSYCRHINGKFILIEQVADVPYKQYIDEKFYAKYRSHDEIVNVFESAGFDLVRHKKMGERSIGLFAMLMFNRFVYPILPGFFKRVMGVFLTVDRFLMKILPSRSVPHIDVVYEFKKSPVL